jgi:hypothetical protein
MEHKKREVRIHIDREAYESPTPTTGEALYVLAGIPAHRELFREVNGDREDELVPRDATEIHLVQDEHFYSEKEMTVIVNTEEKLWNERRISYAQVTHLAFPSPPPGVVITYTVEYERGPHKNPEGSMTAGESVRVKNGMIFSVTETGRS